MKKERVHSMGIRMAVLFWCLLLAVPTFAAQVIEGRVVGISDGDTITVLTPEKRQVKSAFTG